ncbi:MAG: hypothetical protein AAGI71_05720 [Bacteroidota bacterium]
MPTSSPDLPLTVIRGPRSPLTIHHSPFTILFLLLAFGLLPPPAQAQTPPPTTPVEFRGRIDAEREGTHDANRMRTLFYNYGMVGDFQVNPDLTIFNSVEVPKGIGLNYSDGITPFVLARIQETDGGIDHIMLTGFRERQARSPRTGRIMRFEPRPGYFEEDPNINQGRSVALSNDPRTWPGAVDASGRFIQNQDPANCWYDKRDDLDDPGWCGSWNGFFGKRPNADQESFTVMDDNFYDAWNFFPDSRDPTRRGLGLRVEVRGFQWSNPQAQDVIFWHYDIINESTTTYEDIIFGLYMDSGVGGSSVSCDNVAESDDDNAFFNTDFGLDLVYTWDRNGNGVSLRSNCEPTGFLGYAYLETPGDATNGIDDDSDGITDEQRDGGPGQRIEGQDAIRAAVQARYNMADFEAEYGPLVERPAFIAGVWWTGDEDLDWTAENNDTGADGVFSDPDDEDDLPDRGENDDMPTAGEQNFDQTDITESDLIGLTGFKMNRIRGAGETDNIVFFEGEQIDWPEDLYNLFTSNNPNDRFDQALVENFNIGFLFASGPFPLVPGRRERFSLALAFGADLTELQSNVEVVQAIYNANYQFATPPALPTLQAHAGDGFVTLTWDNVAERSVDPVTNRADFEGYRIYRSTDPFFLDAINLAIDDPRDARLIGPNGAPIAQFDLDNGINGYSDLTVDGIAYYLGNDSGITHTYRDTTVTNGQTYYYAVTSYDRGEEAFNFFPSENAITVSRTARSGTILPRNVAFVRPNALVPGYTGTQVPLDDIQRVSGTGTGTMQVRVLNPTQVPEDGRFRVQMQGSADSVRAETYVLIDESTGEELFEGADDFEGLGTGPAGFGLQPVLQTLATVEIDTTATGFQEGSQTDAVLSASYQNALPINLRRPGFPEDLIITFADTPLDTSRSAIGQPAVPAHFRIETAESGLQLEFSYRDVNDNRTIDAPGEVIDIFAPEAEGSRRVRPVWQFVYSGDDDGTSSVAETPPGEGDRYRLALNRPFSSADAFSFSTTASFIDEAAARASFEDNEPYVVPNPYRGGSAFESERFASNEFVRQIQFRRIPAGATIKIYTLRGHLVETLRQDDTIEGTVAWDLRSKDNLEIAPGLYLYHVDAPGVGEHVGKFAIIK